jgi:DNA repair ATPase RecN
MYDRQTQLSHHDQRYQLERLISLSEQANARSQGVEMMLQRLRIMDESIQIPRVNPIEGRSDEMSRANYTVVNATPLSSAPPSAGECICSNSTTIPRQDSVHISRKDLDRCAEHIRTLLNAVEDAQSAKDGATRCENIINTYRDSLDVLHSILPVQPKRVGRLRRLFSGASVKRHRGATHIDTLPDRGSASTMDHL